MSFLGRLSSSDLQSLTFPRRELPGKLLVIIGAALLLPKPQPEVPVTPTEVQPEFKIGDLVASDWEPDQEDDDVPDSATDFGEVLGMRWVPEPDYCSLSANTWVYFVRWTHSTCKGCAYPCYDGEPTEGSALRLVTRPGGHK